jgi:chromosome segregation ATPase
VLSLEQALTDEREEKGRLKDQLRRVQQQQLSDDSVVPSASSAKWRSVFAEDEQRYEDEIRTLRETVQHQQGRVIDLERDLATTREKLKTVTAAHTKDTEFHVRRITELQEKIASMETTHFATETLQTRMQCEASALQSELEQAKDEAAGLKLQHKALEQQLDKQTRSAQKLSKDLACVFVCFQHVHAAFVLMFPSQERQVGGS